MILLSAREEHACNERQPLGHLSLCLIVGDDQGRIGVAVFAQAAQVSFLGERVFWYPIQGSSFKRIL